MLWLVVACFGSILKFFMMFIFTDTEFFEPPNAEDLEEALKAHPLPVAQHLMARQETSSWQETVNYLGYTNKHQAAVYTLLLQQAQAAKYVIYRL